MRRTVDSHETLPTRAPVFSLAKAVVAKCLSHPLARHAQSAPALALALLTSPLAAETRVESTDSFIMGAGRWTCAQLIEVATTRAPLDLGQAAGWVLGAWSRATTERERGFVDIVERVGGTGIFDATVAECRKAAPDTMLYHVVYGMIDTTNPGRE